VSFSAPVGTDVLQVTSYPQANGGGSALGTASLPATITANAQNVVALDIGGNIAQLQMYLSQSTFTPGASATALVVIVPLDASGAVIVNPGNYNPSISVTSSDTSGAFSLILDGANSGRSATVASPNDQLVLSYSGAGSANTNITATAGSGVTPFTLSASSVNAALGTVLGGANIASTHFEFTAIGQSGTLAVSGGTPPYTVTSSDTSTATVSGSSPNYTVTATGYGASGLGTATITITDSAAPTPDVSTRTVTVVPAAITATVGTCGSSATCTTSGISFPTTNSGTNLSSTYTLGGGTSSYTDQWVSSATTTSQYASATLVGNALTITPNGAGSDVLLITSGSQTYLIGVNDVAPGTATYSIASAVHAYSPSAGNLTMSYTSTAGNNASATLTLSAGNGPWTVAAADPTIISVSASENGYVLTPLTTGSTTIALTPAVGTAPAPLAVSVIGMLSVSPLSVALHANNDGFSITASNGSPGGLTIGGSSISVNPSSGVVSLLGYASPVLSGSATGVGAATVTFHDTNVDRKVTATVDVDDAYATSLDTALAAYGQTTALGLRVNVAKTISGIPSWVNGVHAASGGLAGTIPLASQVLSVPAATSPTAGTLNFYDSIGGVVSLDYAAMSFTFGYPGASVGAVADEAFTATGVSDTVGVSDGTSGDVYTATSSNPGVVSASGGTGSVSLASLSAGTSTITVVDTSQGNAATTFTVSVTTTTIPVSSRNRR